MMSAVSYKLDGKFKRRNLFHDKVKVVRLFKESDDVNNVFTKITYSFENMGKEKKYLELPYFNASEATYRFTIGPFFEDRILSGNEIALFEVSELDSFEMIVEVLDDGASIDIFLVGENSLRIVSKPCEKDDKFEKNKCKKVNFLKGPGLSRRF